jgi:hypothetical protein
MRLTAGQSQTNFLKIILSRKTKKYFVRSGSQSELLIKDISYTLSSFRVSLSLRIIIGGYFPLSVYLPDLRLPINVD